MQAVVREHFSPLSVHEGRAHAGDLERDCDVVVVGSGAGGATVATELALAGQRVIVIEEGRHVPADQYGAMRQSESLRHVWREGGLTAAFGIGGAPTVNVTMGKVVGGSSVCTGGVCFRVPGFVLDEWSREMGIPGMTATGLDPFYSHVEKAIHVEEVPVSMRSRSTELFAIGAEKLGRPVKPMRRNTRGCDGCGRCNFGCPHVAKLSVDVSYLPRAIAAGAEVWSQCLVERVRVANGRAIGVEGRLLNGPRGAKGGRLRVRAKRVVVACGGIHTPVLLQASGLGGIGSHVGKHLTLHPGFRVYARFDEKVRGWAGAMQSAYSDALEHEGITMNSLFVPASVIAATMPGAGPDHVRLAEQVGQIAMFGAMVHDEGGGYVVRNPFGREPLVLYRCSKKDVGAFWKGIRAVGETFLEAGAKELFLPILGSHGLTPDQFRALELERTPVTRLECASQHPLGTARMGTSAAHGAVDPWGESWDVKELFVADASILPSSLGVNPQLTVMAMATRIAWHLRERKLPS
ncbi:GMC family oxidoreductase N-terminal domain-containing protein [Sandaracinus amylolyticus]|nr:GMC family oxidoreductase [Sandaracinus amylolyticus]